MTDEFSWVALFWTVAIVVGSVVFYWVTESEYDANKYEDQDYFL